MHGTATDLTAITDRLARLEHAASHEKRAIRRWRVTALGACLAVAALVGLGQAAPAPDVIQARRFSLVTEEGDELGALFLGADGAPSLRLNAPGHPDRSIGLKATARALTISCQWDNLQHAEIGVFPLRAGIFVGALKGQAQAGLLVEDGADAVIATFDADRNLLWKSN